jgi:hypothetical protein
MQFGIPALLRTHTPGTIGFVTILRLTALPLIIVGLAFYARMKGRSGAWGLLGVLSCIGLLILALLGKKCQNCRTQESRNAKECKACGAPLIP